VKKILNFLNLLISNRWMLLHRTKKVLCVYRSTHVELLHWMNNLVIISLIYFYKKVERVEKRIWFLNYYNPVIPSVLGKKMLLVNPIRTVLTKPNPRLQSWSVPHSNPSWVEITLFGLYHGWLRLNTKGRVTRGIPTQDIPNVPVGFTRWRVGYTSGSPRNRSQDLKLKTHKFAWLSLKSRIIGSTRTFFRYQSTWFT